MRIIPKDQAPAAKLAARETWVEVVALSSLEAHLKEALMDEAVLERWFG